MGNPLKISTLSLWFAFFVEVTSSSPTAAQCEAALKVEGDQIVVSPDPLAPGIKLANGQNIAGVGKGKLVMKPNELLQKLKSSDSSFELEMTSESKAAPAAPKGCAWNGSAKKWKLKVTVEVARRMLRHDDKKPCPGTERPQMQFKDGKSRRLGVPAVSDLPLIEPVGSDVWVWFAQQDSSCTQDPAAKCKLPLKANGNKGLMVQHEALANLQLSSESRFSVNVTNKGIVTFDDHQGLVNELRWHKRDEAKIPVALSLATPTKTSNVELPHGCRWIPDQGEKNKASGFKFWAVASQIALTKDSERLCQDILKVVTDAGVKDPAESEALKEVDAAVEGNRPLVVISKDGNVVLGVPKSVRSCSAPQGSADTNGNKNWCPVEKADRRDERQDMRRDRTATLCLDLSTQPYTVTARPRGNLVPPNTALKVIMNVGGEKQLDVAWDGTRGLVEPSTITPRKGTVSAQGATSAQPMIRTFSPRTPGPADVLVTSLPDEEGETKTYAKVELQVDELAWGAIRVGFGVATGGAVSNGWELRKFAGSEQPEIVKSEGPRHRGEPKAQVEGVIGVAPYLLDVLVCPGRGRSHRGGCNIYVAPYVGFGIVGQTASGPEAFNSIHVGGELEFSKLFSLALTGVLRKRTELARGYAEGSPADVDTVFTTTTWGWGLGMVLNVSADFLQFSVPSNGGST